MIYVIRHGQTDLNKDGRTQGKKGLPLNDIGKQQAYEAKETLKDIHFDLVFSSPQERAIQTAQIATGIKPTIDERLDAMDMGTADNMKKQDIKVVDFLPDRAIYSGVETLDCFVKRITNFMDELIKKINKQNLNILICGHKCTTAIIHCYFNGMPENKNFWQYGLKNGQLQSYDIKGAK